MKLTIDKASTIVDQALAQPVDIIVIGGTAAALHYGVTRATHDIDTWTVVHADLAAAAVSVLGHPTAAGQTYFVCSPETITGRVLADEVARQMNRWTLPCPLPPFVLWPVCLGQEICARITGRAAMLNLQKFAELRAPGWVCDGSKLKSETGCECETPLAAGIAATLAWYTRNAWL